jgi:hypothetical protein
MRTSAIIVGLSLLFTPVERGGAEHLQASTGSEIPCGQCHDYRYTSDTGLYAPFYSHTFGGGGVAVHDGTGEKVGLISGEWQFVATSWSSDPDSHLTSREDVVSLASIWRGPPECPTAGAQSCEHQFSANVECNSPDGHGCHPTFGAGMCSGSHYPCRYPPGGWPESAARNLQSGDEHSQLVRSFRVLANASTFSIEDGQVRFFSCDGSTKFRVSLRPALDRAIASALQEGLIVESGKTADSPLASMRRSDNL